MNQKLQPSAKADAEKVASGQTGKQDISGKQLQQHNTNGAGVGESNRVAQAQSQSQSQSQSLAGLGS